MLNITSAVKIIEEEINSLIMPDSPENLYAPVKYALACGGKRIRPALTLIACNLFNEDYKKALYPALGIELFHNFTLIHDDLMDNSPLRRNDPTVHVRWNPNIAILAGDAMYILASMLVSKVEGQYFPEVQNIFNQTALMVCEGQTMDMDFEKKSDVTVDQYLQMIGLKTSVLLASSLKIGAITGGADQQSANDIYNFGYNIGLAFQLQDDLLDAYGDTNVFGKMIGNDIITNKKTFLYIKSMNLASPETRKKLEILYSGETENPGNKISQVKTIFDHLSITNCTQDIINEHFNKAQNCLDNIKVSKQKKSVLEEFAFSLKNRKK